MKQKTKLLKSKLDVVFQAIFGEIGSERITKSFLEEILETKINKIELNQNPVLRREHLEDKLGILDVVAKINENENCDIEMQIAQQEDIKERLLFYWSKMYARDIKKGDEYCKLEKSIVILITDKKLKGLEELECHTEWKIIETETRQKILTDKLEIHIIELEKLYENKGKSKLERGKFKMSNKEKEENKGNVSEGLEDWLEFLVNPESERLKEKMKENAALKEAYEKLKRISEDPQMRQLAWWREKGIYEENARRRRDARMKEREEKIIQMEKNLANNKKEVASKEKEVASMKEEVASKEKEVTNKQKQLEKREYELQEFEAKLKRQQIKLEEEQIKLKEQAKQLGKL